MCSSPNIIRLLNQGRFADSLWNFGLKITFRINLEKMENNLDGTLSGYDSIANVCEHDEKYLGPSTFLTDHLLSVGP